MIIIDIPRDSEKNICPPATARTLIQPAPWKASQLGLNIKARPSEAPGRVTLLIITITSITKRAGIAMEVNFSMPPDTPFLTINTVRKTKISEKITV